MKNKDALKKHHFWILLGFVPLLVMIAVITISSSVGSAIDKRVEDFSAAEKSLQGKNPKSNALIEKIDEQMKKIGDKKTELWRINWERQKDMYVWPNSPLLKAIEKKNLAFGAPLPNDNFEFDEFRKPEVYLAEYSTANPKKGIAPSTGIADTIAPTQFLGGWQSILRHVNAWDDRALTSPQVWLLMEDLWVQRAMLAAIRSVNSQMAEFQRVKYEKDGVVVDDPDPKGAAKDPLRRKFRSRIWEVELQVTATKDNKRILGGRLINHTDRLQLMGLNNTMILKVWFEKDVDERGRPRPDVRPFEFKIGGEFLAGKGALKPDGKTPANELDIVKTDDHTIPVTQNVTEIYKVEQVFDTRTVPVRRIEAMALGFPDSRYAGADLIPPTFFKDAPSPEGGVGGGLPSPGGEGGQPPRGPGLMPGLTPGGVGGGVSGGGTVEAVINAKKKRYIQLTENVRRLPVAVAVVVDQAYMQDVLLAYANSPLKFQTTQVTWARFRGSLNTGTGTVPGTTPGSPETGGVVFTPGITSGSSINLNTPGGEGGGAAPPRGLPGPMGPPPGPGGPLSPYGMGGNASTVSESQLTSGLIELSVYGVASLYEKFQAPGETPKEPVVTPEAKAKEAKDVKEPKGKAPKEPKDKEEKEPKDKAPVPEPKEAKMRRRAR